jgi:long-chain acyl-CoA synthetase
MDIANLLSRHAQYQPDKLALIFEDRRLTYKEYNQNVNRLANALLDMGIKKGDKISTLLPNCMEILEVYWAAAKIGAVAVPHSMLLLADGLKSLLNDSDTTMVVTNSSMVKTIDGIRKDLPAISEDRFLLIDSGDTPGYRDYHGLKTMASDADPQGIEIHEDDVYNIMYSSGTTGHPKGIVISHKIRVAYATLSASIFRMTPESVMLHSGALVFNGAFITLLTSMFLGSTFILHPQFDTEALIDTVKKEKVTHVMMVPSQVVGVLHSPNFSAKALSTLEMICSVGAPLHKEHKEELIKHLPNRLYELYGLTEGFMTILDRNDYETKTGSVGAPTAFFDLRIEDDDKQQVPPGVVGEIVGKGPIQMVEYYKRPEMTRQAVIDGWLYTGDMGYVDEDGFLYLVDRKKDMIISGGVNVYPKDIEEIIVHHPDVKEAAVFGIQDEKWGETPIAAVTLAEMGSITAEDLVQWTNERVSAKFQRIHQAIILGDFPRNAAGKTMKRTIRDDFLKTDTQT